ncbi:MAG TPA: ribonuclease P protein component [bacterium]|nr:ribonuclease P protein component [bacterium]
MKKRDILLVNRSRHCLRTRHFIIKVIPNQLAWGRIAFVFPKRFGIAVLRNRFKRRLRVVVSLPSMVGKDFLCIAKGPLSQLTDVLWKNERNKIRTWCENF